ncbi:MAG: threonine synthase [Candidatus Caldarchaeum sp.]|nr:threonine synthase [Candidatus Caldarchaeum sp.]MDW8360637.1 threonine synthase [Candidatus Caldarchaeum sp.]
MHDGWRDRVSSSGVRGVWRYAELLPVQKQHRVDIGAGGTPLVRSTELGKAVGIRNLYVKNDTVNPTYSFKDRPSSVAVSKAREFGINIVGCASTGNLASATLAHAAAAGLVGFVLMPDTVELPKVKQASIYGGNVILVDGTYDDVNRLAYLLVDRSDVGIVNVNLRPYYVEGSKTMMYEVVEHLGWRAPQHIVVPMASGALFGALHKGLRELEQFGVLESAETVFHGVQPEGCSPISTAYAAGTDEIRPVKKPETLVKSLAIGTPGDGAYALTVARTTGGTCQAVSDEETVEAIKLLSKHAGIFAEPGGAVTVAAVKKMRDEGVLDTGDEVVCCVTGAGFKVDEVVDRIVGPTHVVPAKLQSILDVLKDRPVITE